MCLQYIEVHIPVGYLMSSSRQNPLNDLTVLRITLERLRRCTHFYYLTGNHWSLFSFLNIILCLTLFDLAARRYHSSTNVDSTLLLALWLNMFLCKFPLHQLFNSGEFESGVCVCVCVSAKWSRAVVGLHLHLNRRRLWNKRHTDRYWCLTCTRSLVSQPSNLVNCNYSGVSVLEILKGRAVLWSNACANDAALYSYGNQLDCCCLCPNQRHHGWRHLAPSTD